MKLFPSALVVLFSVLLLIPVLGICDDPQPQFRDEYQSSELSFRSSKSANTRNVTFNKKYQRLIAKGPTPPREQVVAKRPKKQTKKLLALLALTSLNQSNRK